MRFQGKLTWLFPSRFVSSFLETLDSFCIPSMYFYPMESPHFIPLLNPRSFLQWYTTVLDVCAVMVRVGKMLSMLWCSFVCVNGARSIRPVVIQMGDSINHTINPTGTGGALAPGLPALPFPVFLLLVGKGKERWSNTWGPCHLWCANVLLTQAAKQILREKQALGRWWFGSWFWCKKIESWTLVFFPTATTTVSAFQASKKQSTYFLCKVPKVSLFCGWFTSARLQRFILSSYHVPPRGFT